LRRLGHRVGRRCCDRGQAQMLTLWYYSLDMVREENSAPLEVAITTYSKGILYDAR